MDPNQQPVYSPQYGYSAPPPKKPAVNKQMAIFVLLAIGLVLGIVMFMLNLGANDSKKQNIILIDTVVAQEQELLRLNTLAKRGSADYDIANVGANINTLTQSSLFKLTTYRAKVNKEKNLNEEVVLKTTDTEADARFQEAIKINRFKSEFKSTFEDRINLNLTTARTLYQNTKDEELQSILDQSIKNNESLLQEVQEL
jgi:hypothetical protein